MELERITNVQTTSGAIVENIAVPSSKVAKYTVLGTEDAILFDDTVPKIITKNLPTALQPKSTKSLKNDRAVLHLIILQQKIPICKEETMTSLKRKSLLRMKRLQIQSFSRLQSSMKNGDCFIKHSEGPNLLKKICLPPAWVRDVVTMKTRRLRSAANTQLEVNKVLRLKV